MSEVGDGGKIEPEATSSEICLYSILSEVYKEHRQTERFLNCEGNTQDCVLGCANYPSNMKPLHIALLALTDEVYKLARVLYSMQKRLEEGKEVLLERKAPKSTRDIPYRSKR